MIIMHPNKTKGVEIEGIKQDQDSMIDILICQKKRIRELEEDLKQTAMEKRQQRVWNLEKIEIWLDGFMKFCDEPRRKDVLMVLMAFCEEQWILEKHEDNKKTSAGILKLAIIKGGVFERNEFILMEKINEIIEAINDVRLGGK